MTTLKVVVEVELPEEVMDLLERLVSVLEDEYEQRYVRGINDHEDDGSTTT